LARLRNLKDLDLRSTRVSDRCIADLVKLKNLITLNIADTGITHAVLQHLSSLTELRELHVGESGMSTNALARFHRRCPKVRIIRWIPTGENTWTMPSWNVFLEGEVPEHPADRFFLRGQEAMNAGHQQQAILYFTKALDAHPRYVEAMIERAICLVRTEELHEALADVERVIDLQPQHLPPRAVREVHLRRVNLLVRLGRHEKALQAARQAIEVIGDCLGLMNLRALVLAASRDANVRDGRLALVIATSACETSDWDEHEPIAVLAAASAEVGDFDKAVKYQETAISLVRNVRAGNALDEYRDRLQCYKAAKPYRLPLLDVQRTRTQPAAAPR